MVKITAPQQYGLLLLITKLDNKVVELIIN
jgi:hypothetical protein